MTPLVLAIDLESSDIPPKGMQVGDPLYPWPVTLAAVLFPDDGSRLRPPQFFAAAIRNETGAAIKAGAEAVHGVSTRQSTKTGVSQIAALGLLIGLAAQATRVVGWNLGFDRDIISSALVRLGKSTAIWQRPGLQFLDLMEVATPIMRLPFARDDGAHRWPSLDEACSHFLDWPPRERHDAWEDTERVEQLYLSLRNRGNIEAIT